MAARLELSRQLGRRSDGVAIICRPLETWSMLPADEWDKWPDIVSVLKSMIMDHLKDMQDGYVAERIAEDMELRDNELFREVEPADVLDAVEATLRALELDGMLQSKRVRISDSILRFYRPVP